MTMNYSDSFKAMLVTASKAHGVPAVSKEFNVPPTTIRGWIKRMGDDLAPVVVEGDRNVKLDLLVAKLYKMKSDNTSHHFDLTFADFRKLVKTATCAYTGAMLDHTNTSVERINPFVGYTPENTVLVTKEANDLKARLDHFIKNPTIPKASRIMLLKKMAEALEASDEKGEPVDDTDWGKFLMRCRELSKDSSTDLHFKSGVIHAVCEVSSVKSVEVKSSPLSVAKAKKLLEGVPEDLYEKVRKFLQTNRQRIITGNFQ